MKKIYIWFNPILKILFEVYIELYHDYKNVHYEIVLWKLEIIVLLRTTKLLMPNSVKNPASFFGCRSGSGSGQIIAIRFRFRPEFPFWSHTGSYILY